MSVALPGPGVDDDSLLWLLADWVPAQRWFPAKGTSPRLALRGRLVLAEGDEVVVAVHVVAVRHDR